MQRMWAPWRMAYIEKADSHDGCILCEFPAEQNDRARFILVREPLAYVMLNAYPYSNGHLMVCPLRHVADLSELSEAEALDVHRLVARCIRGLRRAYAPHGFNIGVNMGRVAGAGIESHVHVHVVPRWNGDTNFMAVVGDTRVVPASLDATYERLREHMRDV